MRLHVFIWAASLLFCLFALPARASSDTITTPAVAKYRIRSATAGFVSIKDRFLSPLIYQGVSVGNVSQHIRHTPTRIRHLTYSGLSALLINGANTNLMPAFVFELDYAQHYLVASVPHAGLYVYAGGLINSMLLLKANTGNVNNVLGYDGMAALHASGLIQYDFRLFNSPFRLFYGADLPLAGVLLRPEYSWAIPYPIWEGEGGESRSLQFASWQNYRRIRMRTTLDFNIAAFRHRSHWRAGYAWDYFRTDRRNPSQYGAHMFSLGRIFTL
jgi:hypothetical protein